MSKAFKSNDDAPDDEPLDFQAPEDDGEDASGGPRGKQYITKEGAAKMHAELKQLLPPATVEYIEKQPTLEDVFLSLVGDGATGTNLSADSSAGAKGKEEK